MLALGYTTATVTNELASTLIFECLKRQLPSAFRLFAMESFHIVVRLTVPPNLLPVVSSLFHSSVMLCFRYALLW